MTRSLVRYDFSPDSSGERVGWVRVERVANDPDTFVVDATVATVDNFGGRVEYEFSGDELLIPKSEGLFSAASISAVINRGRVMHPGGVVSFTDAPDTRRSNAMYFGAIDNRPMTSVEWLGSSAKIIENLKGGMAEAGITSAYPDVYYALNGLIGHNQHPSVVSRGRTELKPHNEIFVADPDMAETTRQQLWLVESMVTAYEAAMEEDGAMSSRLTVFSDVPASEVPGAFERSRQRIAELEGMIAKARDGLAVPNIAYLPVGFRPKGRTWPYMDPTNSDAKVSYGNELRHLRLGNAGAVLDELGQELAELGHRATYARWGKKVLSLLAAVEQAA